MYFRTLELESFGTHTAKSVLFLFITRLRRIAENFYLGEGFKVLYIRVNVRSFLGNFLWHCVIDLTLWRAMFAKFNLENDVSN